MAVAMVLVAGSLATAAADGATCSMRGTPRADRLTGGWNADRICGLAGNDLLFGDGWPNGPAGADVVFGGGGDDEIAGGDGDGDDLLYGGKGGDTIDGGAGNDVLSGGSGAEGRRLRRPPRHRDRLRGGHQAGVLQASRIYRPCRTPPPDTHDCLTEIQA